MSTFQQFRDLPDPMGKFDGLFRAALCTRPFLPSDWS
jgi:hypothetical protein